MQVILILCKPEEHDSLVDELGHWRGNGASLFLSGFTTKQDCGYIFLAWVKPIPRSFHQKLMEESRILDFFTFNNQITTPRLSVIVGRD